MVVETDVDHELFPAEADDAPLTRDDDGHDETDDLSDDITLRLAGCIFCELGLECLTEPESDDDLPPELVSRDDLPDQVWLQSLPSLENDGGGDSGLRLFGDQWRARFSLLDGGGN
jgi:hypothetical protein